jgi:hypothetical protein
MLPLLLQEQGQELLRPQEVCFIVTISSTFWLRFHKVSRDEQILFFVFLFVQCCGSGSALILVDWIRIQIRIGNSVKMTSMKRKIGAGCSLLSAAFFSCSFYFHHGGLEIKHWSKGTVGTDLAALYVLLNGLIKMLQEQ